MRLPMARAVSVREGILSLRRQIFIQQLQLPVGGGLTSCAGCGGEGKAMENVLLASVGQPFCSAKHLRRGHVITAGKKKRGISDERSWRKCKTVWSVDR